METQENLAELINATIPGEASKFPWLDELALYSCFLPALSPNERFVSLFYRRLRHKTQQARASLCIVHGFGEHSGKYMAMAAFMAIRGIEVHTFDMRHLGHSTGSRAGHDLYELQSDIHFLLLKVNPELPCFLLGHSMGGLLVSTLLVNNPGLKLAGVILSAPLYRNDRVDISLGKFLGFKALFPVLKDCVFNADIHLGSLSREPEYLKGLVNDRKLLPFLGARMGVSMMAHMRSILLHAHKFAYPAVFFHGTSDTLTSPRGTQCFYSRCSSKDKTLRLLHGVYHEPHNDLGREEFLNEVAMWIEQRIDGAQPIGKLGPLKIGDPGLSQKESILKKVLLALVLIVIFLVVRRKLLKR